jgi:hypothetical protein
MFWKLPRQRHDKPSENQNKPKSKMRTPKFIKQEGVRDIQKQQTNKRTNKKNECHSLIKN